MPDIRTFIAIELPEGVKFFLKELVANLRSFDNNVRWARSEGIHLTVKFLGDVNVDLVPAIEKELKPVFAKQTPFSLNVSRVGAFPGLSRPRVIWAGMEDAMGRLGPLASLVETVLEPLGFERERRAFNAHLTLGRVKTGKVKPDLVDAMRVMGTMSGPSFQADHAVLFQSILKPSGAQYVSLRRFDFGLE